MKYTAIYVATGKVVENGDVLYCDGKKIGVAGPAFPDMLGCIAVTLSLCTNDFTLGDTITNIKTGKQVTCSDMGYEDGEWTKVIGAISPEAKWVKPGDLFEEQDVSIRKICHDDSCPPYDSYCTYCHNSSECLNDEGNEVLIKGHCGHFH